MDYDFSKLNAREFEILAGDIISKYFGVKIEIFKAGRDNGVDGRFWLNKSGEGIVQCKHYIKTSYNDLIFKLKNQEVSKVKKLNPKKYIFVTSKDLSRENKKEIKKLFSPYIKREDDVWGKDDLNQFLLNNSELVEKHYKLWITSTHVLKTILNNAIIGRSEHTIKEIAERSKKYIVTENHNTGLDILKEKNVVIITGEPGIGKTTLADNLALAYVANGFEFCEIEESISEAENLFLDKEKKKIVFYFDDFLGSHLLDAISRKNDSHIIKFIDRVKKDNSKKFILTSRTILLNKGYSLSAQFQNKNIRDNEFLLNVDNLTKLDRARILYSHIYFSDLENDYIDKIYEDKKYHKIIGHHNFNPRIIEFITTSSHVGQVKPEEYWEYIQELLKNPKDIWDDYFQTQTDPFIRSLIFLTVFNKGHISEKLLKESYQNFKDIQNLQPDDHTDKSFSAVVKLATKSLLNRSCVDGSEYIYGLFNASIADYILNNYFDNIKLVLDIAKSLKSIHSLEYLDTLGINKIITEKNINSIQTDLFEYTLEEAIKEESWDYLISLAYLNLSNTEIKDKIILFLKKIIMTKPKDTACFEKLEQLLVLLDYYEYDIGINDYSFILNFIRNRELTEDESTELLNFIEKYEIDNPTILEETEGAVYNYVKNELDLYKSDIDLRPFVQFYHDEERSHYDIDERGIKDEIDKMLDNNILKNFNTHALNQIGFDSSKVTEDFDINRMVDDHISSIGSDYADDLRENTTDITYGNDIDAIFERS